MSCILYSRASYVKLAAQLAFRCLWRDLLTSVYESPEAFAEALFEFNAQAYRDRYADDGEEALSATIEAERENTTLDHKFAAFIAARHGIEPKACAALYQLFRRIDYQCSDARDRHTLPVNWHLVWSLGWCAEKMVAAIEGYTPPAKVDAAAVRRELESIARSAQDSSDLEAGEQIGRAAARAIALLNPQERRPQPAARAAA